MEMDVATLQKEFGIEALKISKLRENILVITNDQHEDSVLKSLRLLTHNNWVQSHRFRNEVRVYQAIRGAQLKHLHTAKVINCTGNQLLIEYLEKIPSRKAAPADFVNAYLELQQIKISSSFWFDLRNQIVRGFFYRGMILPFTTLARRAPLKTCFKAALLFVRLALSVKKLNNAYWLHGDLHEENVFYRKQDEKLYFIDFENMLHTRKWMLVEVAGLGHVYNRLEDKLEYEPELLNEFLHQANTTYKEDLRKVNVKAQFRMSLLLRCTVNIASTKVAAKRKTYEKMLNLCVSDNKFSEYYNLTIKPQLVEPVARRS